MQGMNYSQRLRGVRLRRRHGEAFGFAIRGGKEHNLGFYVSHVEPHSQAEAQGLKVGDQVVRINGFPIEDALHHEVLSLMKAKTHLRLKVRSTGVLPVPDDQPDDTWGDASGDFFQKNSASSYRLSSTSNSSTSSSNSASSSQPSNDDTTKIYINLARSDALGCTITKGPSQQPGVFIQSATKGGIAYGVGLRPGDQIVQCNGRSFDNISFTEAVRLLKESRQLDLTILKGAGLDLFAPESSGYNSTNSSVNGDQSPVLDDRKRLSVVREEYDAADERRLIVHGNVSVDTRKDWDEIEKEWTQAELHQEESAQRRLSSDSGSTLKDESHKFWQDKLELEAAQQSLEEEKQRLAQERIALEEEKQKLERQRSSLTSTSSSDSESSHGSKKGIPDVRLAHQHDQLMEEFKEAQRNRLSLEEDAPISPETIKAKTPVSVQSRPEEPQSMSIPPPPSVPAPPPPQLPMDPPASRLKKTSTSSVPDVPLPDYANSPQPTKTNVNSNSNRPGTIEQVVLRKVNSGPANISIGSYPSHQDRPSPTKLDFLPPSTAASRESKVNPRDQLQAELAETLSRARFRQRQEGDVTPLPPSSPARSLSKDSTKLNGSGTPLKEDPHKANTVATRHSSDLPKTNMNGAYLNPKANTMNVKPAKITTNAEGKEEFIIEKSVRIRPGLRLPNGELNLAGLKKFGVKKPAPGIQAVLDALTTAQQQPQPSSPSDVAVTSPKSPVKLQTPSETHNNPRAATKLPDNTVKIAVNGKGSGILKNGNKHVGTAGSNKTNGEASSSRTISFGKTTMIIDNIPVTEL